jgi:hypothetical protein
MLEVLCLSARFALCGGLVLNVHNLEVFVNTETMHTFSISRGQRLCSSFVFMPFWFQGVYSSMWKMSIWCLKQISKFQELEVLFVRWFASSFFPSF